MLDRVFRFTGPMERLSGQFSWYYVEFPYDVEELFGTRSRVRVIGTINGVAVDRALLPTKNGFHIIILGADIRRPAKLKNVGDLVKVEVRENPDPMKLDIPEELEESLGFFPEMKAAWDELTPGMKRSMCYWVGSAKTVATRAKRVAELLRRFETGHFQVGKGPKDR